MRKLALALLLLLGACRNDCGGERLNGAEDPRCGETCYTYGEKPVGACRAGTWSCDTSGNVTTCDGQVGPGAEQCDGLDHNCNGVPNDIDSATCGSSCGSGLTVCDAGSTWCTAQQPQPISFCYTGDAGTEFLPGCHPGTLQCPLGGNCCSADELTCQGEAVPHPGGNWDVVVAVTQDSSMAAWMGPYAQSIGTWCDAQGFRCALVATPDTNQDLQQNNDGGVFVIQDFGTGAQVQAAMVALPLAPATQTGDVATLGMPMEIATGLPLSWQQTQNRLIVEVTDEEDQCTNGAPCPTEAQLGAAMQNFGARFLMFLNPDQNYGYQSICNAMANPCKIYNIWSGPAAVNQALDSMASSVVCY